MVSSKATTVKEYIASLPAERAEVIQAVRAMVRKNLPKDFEETMNWGMICYQVSQKAHPKTYDGRPVGFAALAAQKNYYALYLSCVYSGKDNRKLLESAFKAAGKRLDMGKCCLRFKKLDDIPLVAIGKIIGSISLKKYIACYEAAVANGTAY